MGRPPGQSSRALRTEARARRLRVRGFRVTSLIAYHRCVVRLGFHRCLSALKYFAWCPQRAYPEINCSIHPSFFCKEHRARWRSICREKYGSLDRRRAGARRCLHLFHGVEAARSSQKELLTRCGNAGIPLAARSTARRIEYQ